MTRADPTPSTWHVYVVRCAGGTLYTGIATDVERRFVEHAEGRGAKYLRGRAPLELVAHSQVGARGLALRVEHRIKRLARAAKESLIESGLEALIAEERRRLDEAASV